METRAKGAANKQFSEEELSQVQVHLKEKERRLEEKAERIRIQELQLEDRANALDQEKLLFESQSQTVNYTKDLEKRLQAMQSELSRLQASSTNEPPQMTPSAPYVPRSPSRSDDFYSKTTMQETINTVPQFDGYNVPVLKFIRACRRVKEVLPPGNEISLVRLLISRLRGEAYTAVEDEHCSTVHHLCDILRESFSVHKTSHHYRGELVNTYMRRGETILNYISRVRDLRAAIMDAERTESVELHRGQLNEIDEFVFKCFLDGLTEKIRSHPSIQDSSNFMEACALARKIYKRLELDDDRERRDRRSYESEPPRRREREMRATVINENRSANQNFRPRHPPPPPQRYAPPRPNSGTLDPKFCKYCKTPGHTIDECRKRQYNNSRRDQPGNDRTAPSRPDSVREPLSNKPVKIINSTDVPSTSAQ